jgi:hypothetical protein
MSFIIVITAAFLCTIPSSLIAKAVMKRRGQDLSMIDAPYALMQVGKPFEKIALISLNFAVLGTAIWLLVRD